MRFYGPGTEGGYFCPPAGLDRSLYFCRLRPGPARFRVEVKIMKRHRWSQWLAGALLLALAGCATPNSGQTVWVKGEVQKGSLLKVDWVNGMTAWDAVEKAGGVTFYASDCVLVRRDQDKHTVFKGTVFNSRSCKLRPSDVVIVMKE